MATQRARQQRITLKELKKEHTKMAQIRVEYNDIILGLSSQVVEPPSGQQRQVI